MIFHNDQYIGYDENTLFRLAYYAALGDREEQQDRLGYELRPEEGLVTICDGMGGHDGGKLASALAVEQLLKKYSEKSPHDEISPLLTEAAIEIDAQIAALKKEDGSCMNAGSTLVSVLIRGSSLFWLSIGDSRIYLLRDGEFVQATNDHTYRSLLDEQLAEGKITQEEYLLEAPKGEALISFLGIGGLPRIDCNERPLSLRKGDKILLSTDGLYKLVPHDEIRRVLENFVNLKDALKALDQKAKRAALAQKLPRDNLTAALIQIK